MPVQRLKYPEHVKDLLRKRFARNRHKWLCDQSDFPLAIDLGFPNEETAATNSDGMRNWIKAWQTYEGCVELSWRKRRWRALGEQLLPDKVLFPDANSVCAFLQENFSWQKVNARHERLCSYWPCLKICSPALFYILSDYNDIDFDRLESTVSWLERNPNCQLYPRQLPISGLDSKWFEEHAQAIATLLNGVLGLDIHGKDVYERCGILLPPPLVRMRLMDARLRAQFHGLGDLSMPPAQMALLNWKGLCVYIVENLQTAMSFADLPNAIVIFGLGFKVALLREITWLSECSIYYWGDLDTHGLAILNMVRAFLPATQSLLMDSDTLLSHESLWSCESRQSAASDLPLLNACERDVYQGLKQNRWRHNLRLEQERIAWDYAWTVLVRSNKESVPPE